MNSGLGGFATLDDAAEAIAAYTPNRPKRVNPAGLMKVLRQKPDGRWYWHWDPTFISRGRTEVPPADYQALFEAALAGIRVPTLLVRGQAQRRRHRRRAPRTFLEKVAGREARRRGRRVAHGGRRPERRVLHRGDRLPGEDDVRPGLSRLSRRRRRTCASGSTAGTRRADRSTRWSARRRDAADAGYASFWLPQTMGMDAMTALAVVGREVPDIELGIAVVPTFPRHPIVMAQQALTTQAISGGRLTLGIGLSHQPIIEVELRVLVRQADPAHARVPRRAVPARARRERHVRGRDRHARASASTSAARRRCAWCSRRSDRRCSSSRVAGPTAPPRG